MSLRGTNINTSTSTTVTVSFPAGSVAGDLAYLFVDGAYNITAVSGWTTLDTNSGTTWNHYFASKTLSSGDISTGSVTVTLASSYDCVAGIAVFAGSATQVESQASGTAGSTAQTLTSTSAVTSAATGVYWASARTPGTVSVAVGAGSATLQQTGTTSDSLSRLWTQSMPGGSQANVFHADGVQGYVFQVFVSGGSGGAAGLFLRPALDGLGKFGQLRGGLNG